MALIAKATDNDSRPKQAATGATVMDMRDAAMVHLQAVLMHTPVEGFIELRALPRKDGDLPGTYWLPTNATEPEIKGAVDWSTRHNNTGYDIYLGYNARKEHGKGTKANVPQLTASYIDLDIDKFGINRSEALSAIKNAPIQPNLVVDSGHGLHLIHFHEPIADRKVWSAFQDSLLDHYESYGVDREFTPHESAILRLTPFINQKDPELPPVPTSIVSFRPEESARRFGDYTKAFSPSRKKKERDSDKGTVATDGINRMPDVVDMNRNVTLTKEAGRLRKYGYNESEILAALVALNAGRCNPPLPVYEVEHIANSVSRYDPEEDIIIIDEETQRSLALNFGTFRRTAYPNVEPVIFGLRPSQVGMMQAVPNVGKTTLMLNLAICVAVGRSFEPLYDGGKPRRVLYLDFENTASFLQMDLVRMVEGLDEDEQRLLDENLIVVVDKFINDDPLDLSIPAHFDAVERQAVERGAEIIIVDTLAEGFSMQNENDNSEMKRVVITPLKRIAKMSNACVLVVHHIGKLSEGKGNVGLYRARGASSLPGAARLILGMDHFRDGEGAVVREHVRLSCEKVKGPAFDDKVFRLNFAERWFEPTEVEIEHKDSSVDRIIGLVDQGLKRSEILAKVKEAGLDSSDRTVSRVLNFATSTGLLRKAGHGRWEPTSTWEKRFGQSGDGNPSPQVEVDQLSEVRAENHDALTEVEVVEEVQHDPVQFAGGHGQSNVVEFPKRTTSTKKASKKKVSTKKTASKGKPKRAAASGTRRRGRAYEEV